MYEMSPKDRREAPEAFFSVLLQETKGTPRLEVELLNKKKKMKKNHGLLFIHFSRFGSQTRKWSVLRTREPSYWFSRSHNGESAFTQSR